MAEYQKKVRNRQILKAHEYLKHNNMDDFKRNQNDYRRFIKKVSNNKSKYIIDENIINNEAKYDGFYAIATNIFNESAKDIIKITKRRYKIEECFRVMKTNFEGRPVYHYKEEKIKAHFLICFTALLIYRLMETKLDKSGNHFTTKQIIKTLQNIGVDSIEDAYYKATYTGSNCLSALESIIPLKLDRKYYLAKDLNKLSKIIK